MNNAVIKPLQQMPASASGKRVIDQFKDASEDEFVPAPPEDSENDQDEAFFLPDDVAGGHEKRQKKKRKKAGFVALKTRKNLKRHHCSVFGRHNFFRKSGTARHQT
jgi:hypothetical protein